MKNLIKILAFLALLLVILPLGCQRRSLDDEYYDGAIVQVNIDWADISPKSNFMKIVFYSADGSLAVPRLISTEGEQVRVPFGHYYPLLYNWRGNDEVQSIRFEGSDSDTIFRAYTELVNVPTFAGQALLQPDSLYAWNSSSSIISIVKSSNAIASVVRYSDVVAVNAKPQSLVQQFSFFIPVEGLQYTAGAFAVISGAVQYKNVYNGSISDENHSMVVTVSRLDNGVRCHFSALGFNSNVSKILTINFRLIDGSIFTHTEDLSHEIGLGAVKDLTRPIIIPFTTGSGGFQDPDIGDWHDIHQPIEF